MQDTNAFIHTNQIKYKGLCQLYNIILLSETKISKYEYLEISKQFNFIDILGENSR